MGPSLIIYLAVGAGIMACSLSQVLLKRGAAKAGGSLFMAVVNWRVAVAYGILFGAMLVNIFAFSRGLQLKELGAIESLSYVFVPLFSVLFLSERISRRQICAILLILLGIYVFYL